MCGQEKHHEMEGVLRGCRELGLLGCGEAERGLVVLALCFWLPLVRYPHLVWLWSSQRCSQSFSSRILKHLKVSVGV